MDLKAAQSKRKAWRKGVIALSLPLAWMGACNLNPQPIPPGYGDDGGIMASGDDAGRSVDGGGMGSEDSGPVIDATVYDVDAGDGGDDAGDSGLDASDDGGDASDAREDR